MKVKVLRTDEIVEAKRFKDMTEEEKESTGIKVFCEDEDIFIEPLKGCGVWRYMFDCEVEILEEKKPLTEDELGEELCDYCPLEDNLKGINCYGDGPVFCEDSGACRIAYQNYLDEFEEEN